LKYVRLSGVEAAVQYRGFDSAQPDSSINLTVQLNSRIIADHTPLVG